MSDLKALDAEIESLREQLAEKSDALSEAVTALTLHKDRIESLSAALAEAQATIAAIEERALRERERGGSNASMARIVLSILSAPSSTGGGDDWVDPEPWWYPNSHMRTAHKLPQTTAEYHPRTREQWEAEEGNDHE